MNRLEDFARELHEEVLAANGEETDTDDRPPLLREEAFTGHVLELLADRDEVTGPEICSFSAKGGNAPARKLNAWSLSGDGTTLDLFVTKYFGTGQPADVSTGETKNHFAMVNRFLTLARDGLHKRLEESSPAFEPARRIYQSSHLLTTVRLFLLTDGIVKNLNFDKEDRPHGVEMEQVVWDLEKLSRLAVSGREPVELDFVNRYGGAIPCLEHADPTGEYRTYLAYFRAELVARIYGEHGQRLLERNVRAFLQARGKVNGGLQKTIREEPHRFLAYNNGLCCTAATVTVEKTADGLVLKSAKDFQIVNGGQTTASIYHAVKKLREDLGQVAVQVKLTVLSDPAKVPEIVPSIARYANSQNKVNTADFSANGQYHHHLEQLSRTVWAPPKSGLDRGSRWYYERARGSYADEKARQGTPAAKRQWEAQHPTAQKFTKTDLAKFVHVWQGLAHVVCTGAEKNFQKFAEQMEEDGEPVVDQNYFHRLVAKAILFRGTERLFTSSGLVGLRAQTVAYVVGWVARKSEWRLNLDAIWERQRLPSEVEQVIAKLCPFAHQYLTVDQKVKTNPSEAAKTLACWEDFARRDFDVGTVWLADLAKVPYLDVSGDEERLVCEWERVRHPLLSDSRLISELELSTGKTWVAARRGDPVTKYAGMTWAELSGIRGLGRKRLRTLVELFASATEAR